MYYRKANAAMLVFDITSEDSFDDMRSWVMGKTEIFLYDTVYTFRNK